MSPHYSLSGRQQGVALIVALIFLAVLAILGVTIARNSSMEERMAGNTRDRDLAFQAAESALRDAEDDLKRVPGGYIDAATPFDGSTAGLIAYVDRDADDWKAYTWDNSNSQEATAGIANVNAKPRYVIEKKPNTLIPAVPPSVTPTTVQHFRVTARGVGGSADTIVILQSEYEYN
jgi:type IV pilus assembly protein PilX